MSKFQIIFFYMQRQSIIQSKSPWYFQCWFCCREFAAVCRKISTFCRQLF